MNEKWNNSQENIVEFFCVFCTRICIWIGKLNLKRILADLDLLPLPCWCEGAMTARESLCIYFKSCRKTVTSFLHKRLFLLSSLFLADVDCGSMPKEGQAFETVAG
jgi:hypothetical protein